MNPRWPALGIAMLALSGCATTWSRPATSSTEFNLDSRACQNMNTQLVFLSSGQVGAYIAPSGYQRCMREQGYAEGRSWKGSSGWQDEGPGISDRSQDDPKGSASGSRALWGQGGA